MDGRFRRLMDDSGADAEGGDLAWSKLEGVVERLRTEFGPESVAIWSETSAVFPVAVLQVVERGF